jgi:hypothetical protein
MAKYKVTVGKPFAIDGVEIEDIEAVEKLAAIEERRDTARHRARITYGVLGFMSLAITATAMVGWWDGSYNELNAVWASGSIWVGMVLGRYFKKD